MQHVIDQNRIFSCQNLEITYIHTKSNERIFVKIYVKYSKNIQHGNIFCPAAYLQQELNNI